METHSLVEHICLASEEGDSSERRVVNARFSQRGRWSHSEASFTVFNEHHIAIEHTGFGKRTRDCQLDLRILSSQPKRLVRIDWVPMLLGLALFAWTAAMGAAGAVIHSGFLMAVLFAAALLMLGLALYRSSDRLVYYSKHGRAPLLILRHGNPDRVALQAFVSDISERIRRSRHRWSDRQAFLSAELREHRRLYEQGALSRGEYERAKRRILEKH
ncbi:MAG: SHOCT domain-containing protein [Gammaproteobacteria bacterium]|jgi:hypothetical protein